MTYRRDQSHDDAAACPMKTDKNTEMDDAKCDETSGLSNKIDYDSDVFDSDGDILPQFTAQADTVVEIYTKS